MLFKALVVLSVAYLLMGLALTAFCVHMSYHEAAIGVGQDRDAKARGVLETRWGLLWLLLLVVLWPLALALAVFANRSDQETGPLLQSNQKGENLPRAPDSPRRAGCNEI